MARCELTGKRPVVKNLVSHSNIKTKKVALPNVQQKRLFSRVLNRMIDLKVATSTIRSIEHVGGIDTFILNTNDLHLSKRAMAVKTRILGKMKTARAQGQG
jgi:large subunit ribosomal protein L28